MTNKAEINNFITYELVTSIAILLNATIYVVYIGEYEHLIASFFTGVFFNFFMLPITLIEAVVIMYILKYIFKNNSSTPLQSSDL